MRNSYNVTIAYILGLTPNQVMMTAMTTFAHFRRVTLLTIWMMMVAAAAFFPARADAQTYRYHTQIGSRGTM